MKYISIIFTAIIAIFSTQIVFSGEHKLSPEAEFLASATSWTNQSGSVASISFTASTQPATQEVSGTYINNAAGFNCQGTPYPLSGIYYINTRTISFSVAWSNSSEDCQSVTGWTGYIDLGQTPFKMVTNWNLAYSGASGPEILQGSDTFTMNSIVKSKQLITH